MVPIPAPANDIPATLFPSAWLYVILSLGLTRFIGFKKEEGVYPDRGSCLSTFRREVAVAMLRSSVETEASIRGRLDGGGFVLDTGGGR